MVVIFGDNRIIISSKSALSFLSAKSPVFSHVTSSLSGLLTIRACGAESQLRREFDEQQDGHTAAHFLVVASSVAFGFWIDAVSVAFVVLVSYSFLLFWSGGFAASFVGLALTQVIGLCGSMQSCMKNYAEVVAQMTNVERMFQFTELEQECVNEEEEDHLTGVMQRPPLFWPSKGEIRFERVSLRYLDDAELALRELSFTIEPGMKVTSVLYSADIYWILRYITR